MTNVIQPVPGAKVITLDGTEIVSILGGAVSGIATTQAIADLVTAGNTTGNMHVVGNLTVDGISTLTGNVAASANVVATGNITGAKGTFSGNVATSNLTVTGNATVSGTAGVTGNLTTGNVSATGLIAITGNLTASTTVVATGNVTGGNLTTAGAVAATGTVTGGNLSTGGTLGVSGLASFTLMPKLPVSAPTPAGTVVGNATAVTLGFVTAADAAANTGLVLPTAPAAGSWCVIKNNSGNTTKVYPDASATINAIGSNGPISMTTLTGAAFYAASTTQWYTIPLVPS